jgi:hypothetical protein
MTTRTAGISRGAMGIWIIEGCRSPVFQSPVSGLRSPVSGPRFPVSSLSVSSLPPPQLATGNWQPVLEDE